MEDKRNRGRRITDRITEAYYELMKIVAETIMSACLSTMWKMMRHIFSK